MDTHAVPEVRPVSPHDPRSHCVLAVPHPRGRWPSLSFPSCCTAKVPGQGCGMRRSSADVKEDILWTISIGEPPGRSPEGLRALLWGVAEGCAVPSQHSALSPPTQPGDHPVTRQSHDTGHVRAAGWVRCQPPRGLFSSSRDRGLIGGRGLGTSRIPHPPPSSGRGPKAQAHLWGRDTQA